MHPEPTFTAAATFWAMAMAISADAAPVRPCDVMGNAMECLRGDRLTYWLWGIILDLEHAYAQHYVTDDRSRADPTNPLDALR